MRKYLVAVALGAMLIAGQAAASESDAIGADGNSGAAPVWMQQYGGAWVGLAGALLLGLVAWGFDRQGHAQPIGGRPISP